MSPNSIASVTVIGLGPMGQAITRAFLDAGTSVTVWNRTAAKAAAMEDLGAQRAATVAEALDANDVTVVSLTHYAAVREVLSQAPRHLRGKVIVNLTSDAPSATREGAQWVLDHGGRYLAGGFMSQGEDIRHPLSYIFYSGPADVFEAQKELLRPLSPPEYLGEDYGLAQLFYQGLLTLFHPFVLSFEQALATIEKSGADIDRFTPYARRFLDSMKDFADYFAAEAKAGGWGDEGTLTMMHAGARHVADTSEEVGVSAPLARAAHAVYTQALDESEAEGRTVRTYEVLSRGRSSWSNKSTAAAM